MSAPSLLGGVVSAALPPLSTLTPSRHSSGSKGFETTASDLSTDLFAKRSSEHAEDLQEAG